VSARRCIAFRATWPGASSSSARSWPRSTEETPRRSGETCRAASALPTDLQAARLRRPEDEDHGRGPGQEAGRPATGLGGVRGQLALDRGRRLGRVDGGGARREAADEGRGQGIAEFPGPCVARRGERASPSSVDHGYDSPCDHRADPAWRDGSGNRCAADWPGWRGAVGLGRPEPGDRPTGRVGGPDRRWVPGGAHGAVRGRPVGMPAARRPRHRADRCRRRVWRALPGRQRGVSEHGQGRGRGRRGGRSDLRRRGDRRPPPRAAGSTRLYLSGAARVGWRRSSTGPSWSRWSWPTS